MKKLLWLDDYRDPEIFKNDYNLSKYTSDEIVWVKNYNDFIIWILYNGLPQEIAFDHDLGFTNEYYVENDLPSPETEKNGYDCAKWLIEYCMDYNKKLPDWTILSANPVGAKNINLLLNNFKKIQ